MIVAGSDVPRQRGEVLRDIIENARDAFSQVHRVPFMILREATFDEWVASQTERGFPPTESEKQDVLDRIQAGQAFLYVISVD